MIVTFETTEGRTLGPDVQRVQRMLVVSDDPPHATLSMSRASGDAPGRAIGFFALDLAHDDLEAIREAAKKAEWSDKPSPKRGGPGISFMSLKYQDAQVSQSAEFSRMDIEAMQRVDALLEELNYITGKLYQSPRRALQVSVEKGSAPGQAFLMVLKNVGTDAFCIYDPRRLGVEGGDAFATIQLAPQPPEQPGVTSPALQWEPLPLLGLPDSEKDSPQPLTLAGGAEIKFPTGKWEPKVGIEYVSQAVLSDYEAPVQIGDLPCVRGATFSEHLRVGP